MLVVGPEKMTALNVLNSSARNVSRTLSRIWVRFSISVSTPHDVGLFTFGR